MRRRNDPASIDLELDFRPLEDAASGILVHMIGDQTDFFLSLNEGQITAELVHRDQASTLKSYVPSSGSQGSSSSCGGGSGGVSGGGPTRWHRVSVTLTSEVMRMSVNHQPAAETEAAGSTGEAVTLLERLTVGGGTAAGKEYLIKNIFINFINFLMISDSAEAFHGCVRNIRVNKRLVLPTEVSLQGNVTPNSCPTN